MKILEILILAKKMLYLVAAYFVQWWTTPVLAILKVLAPDVYQKIHIVLIILQELFTDIGGVTNGGVYLLLMRKDSAPSTTQSPNNTEKSSEKSSSV